MERLKKLLVSVKPNLTKEELDELFPEIAMALIGVYGIRKGNELYYFREIEFYYYDPLYDDMRSGEKRRITYERTCRPGLWFFLSSGVDLTFESDKDLGYGGGILIREIEKAGTVDIVSGPKRCEWELFDETADAFTGQATIPRIVEAERLDVIAKAFVRRNLEAKDPWQSLWRFVASDWRE